MLITLNLINDHTILILFFYELRAGQLWRGTQDRGAFIIIFSFVVKCGHRHIINTAHSSIFVTHSY